MFGELLDSTRNTMIVIVLLAPTPEPSTVELLTSGMYFSTFLNELRVFQTSSAVALIVPFSVTLVIVFQILLTY